MPEPMVLALEDGFTVLGERGGQATQASGEVVINTCMTGYQEVLSDPSYAGQMVVMTYPLIGNYGATPDFMESGRPWVRGAVTSRWRNGWTAMAFPSSPAATLGGSPGICEEPARSGRSSGPATSCPRCSSASGG